MILLFFFQLFFRSKKDFCATVIKVHLDSRSSENEDDFWQNEEEFSREEEEGDEGDEEDEEDEEEEEEEEEEETTTTTVVFVRSSVCLRFNNCYFELLSSVFWILLLFFSRRERRIVSICPTKIETMREREREKNVSLFSLRIVFFIPPFLSSRSSPPLFCGVFFGGVVGDALLHQKAQHKE